MPKKKPLTKAKPKSVKKASVSEVIKKPGIGAKDFSFLVILLLFCGVSLYAISSFFFSTNSYLKNMYASVVSSDDASQGVVPDICKPCTDAPECAEFCKVEPYEIFRDVLSNDPIAVPIEKLKDAGVIKGYDDGSFKPEVKITRAEALVILTNVIDADFGGKTYSNCFNDVREDWFAVYVCYAKEQGLISGYPDGTYQPNSNVKKVEALKMLLTALKYEIPTKLEAKPFDDVEVDAWFAPYAYVGKDKGIVHDVPLFDATYELTRGDYAQMVYNAMKAKDLID